MRDSQDGTSKEKEVSETVGRDEKRSKRTKKKREKDLSEMCQGAKGGSVSHNLWDECSNRKWGNAGEEGKRAWGQVKYLARGQRDRSLESR